MKKAIITGNVGRDPISRTDQNGNIFVSVSVAVSVGTKQNPKTDWVEAVFTGKIADTVLNLVTKGTKLLVEGFPKASAYINKDGQAVGTMTLYANSFEFLSKKEDRDPADDLGHQAANELSGLNNTDAHDNNFNHMDVPF